MANPEHLKIFKQGVEVWNKWREENPRTIPDLSDMSVRDLHPTILGININKANFRKVDFKGADLYRSWLVEADFTSADLSNAILGEATLGLAIFRNAVLHGTNLMKAHLFGSDFYEADLTEGALLIDANLQEANLRKAKLIGANLTGANLTKADLSEADLSDAELGNARLVATNLEGATVRNCRVYGISAWNLKIDKQTIQQSLVITEGDKPVITVDNLEVAQFIYLLLNNEKIRDMIDTIGKKGVLIIGRFTEERKALLHAIRDELRNRYDLLPIMFEFKPLEL